MLFRCENWTKSHRKEAASFPGSSPTRPLERGSVPLRGTSRTGPWKRTRLQQRLFAAIPKVQKSAPPSTSWWFSFLRIFSLNPQKNHLSCKSYISRKEKFHGHILRVDNDEAANIFALYEPSHGRKPRGRPRNSFSSKVGEWIDPE